MGCFGGRDDYGEVMMMGSNYTSAMYLIYIQDADDLL